MYRFVVKNNKLDHKPFVVFFCFLAIAFFLTAHSLITQIFAISSSLIAGIISFKKAKQAHPENGTVILEYSQLRFVSDNIQLQGEISRKSYIFANYVVLRLEGFYQSHWLIISAASVEDVYFSRLKRAVIAVQQPT